MFFPFSLFFDCKEKQKKNNFTFVFLLMILLSVNSIRSHAHSIVVAIISFP